MRRSESFKIFDPAVIPGVHDTLSRWKKHSLFLCEEVTQTWIYKSSKVILIKISRRVTDISDSNWKVSCNIFQQNQEFFFPQEKWCLVWGTTNFLVSLKLQIFCIVVQSLTHICPFANPVACIMQHLVIIFPSKLEMVAFE